MSYANLATKPNIILKVSILVQNTTERHEFFPRQVVWAQKC